MVTHDAKFWFLYHSLKLLFVWQLQLKRKSDFEKDSLQMLLNKVQRIETRSPVSLTLQVLHLYSCSISGSNYDDCLQNIRKSFNVFH